MARPKKDTTPNNSAPKDSSNNNSGGAIESVNQAGKIVVQGFQELVSQVDTSGGLTGITSESLYSRKTDVSPGEAYKKMAKLERVNANTMLETAETKSKRLVIKLETQKVKLERDAWDYVGAVADREESKAKAQHKERIHIINNDARDAREQTAVGKAVIAKHTAVKTVEKANNVADGNPEVEALRQKLINTMNERARAGMTPQTTKAGAK